MTPIGAWFAGRSLRERRMIVVMCALLAVTILWAGIIRPVGDGLSSTRNRYADAVIRLGETAARVDAVKSAQRGGIRPLSAPLPDAVRQSADTAGFVLASLEQDGPDRVKIAIATARPAALFGWIAGLEQAGLLVDGLSVTNNGDQTVAVRMTVRARTA